MEIWGDAAGQASVEKALTVDTEVSEPTIGRGCQAAGMIFLGINQLMTPEESPHLEAAARVAQRAV